MTFEASVKMTLEELFLYTCDELVSLKNLYSYSLDIKHESKELLFETLNINATDFLLNRQSHVKNTEIMLVKQNILKRKTGKPLSYITNKKFFYDSEFYIDERVLIPRSETEMIVDYIIKDGQSKEFIDKPILFFDLGSGSGCIGLSLLKKFKKAFLVCIDISNDALNICKLNSKNLGVFDRCLFLNKSVCDVQFKDIKFAKLSLNDFDMTYILSNPPYISREDKQLDKNVKLFEPHISLFAEDEGMKYIKAWLNWSNNFMTKKSVLMFEFGFNQSKLVLKYIDEKTTFKKNSILKDLSGKDRFLICEK